MHVSFFFLDDNFELIGIHYYFSTVVAPAMSIIATELEAFKEQSWIATAYLVAVNSSQPLAGKFCEIFGRKPILLIGQIFLLGGSIICALTPSINGLIPGRTIQGFGAGIIMSMAFIIITDMTPLLWRPRVQSILIATYGLANVVGPLIGGALVDHLTWRWDFWLTVMLGGSAFLIVLFLFQETTQIKDEPMKSKFKRIDFLGSVFSIGFITCLLLALSWGPQYGWDDMHVIGSFAAAGGAFIFLVISEGWIAKEPLIPHHIMLNPSIALYFLNMACLGIGFIGTLFFGPILFQSVFGATSSESSIRLIPFMGCLIVGSFLSSFLMRRIPYFKFYIVVGAACNVVGYGLFQTVDENSNWGQQAGFLTFCGLAAGLSQQNCILGVQTIVKKEDMAVATSLTNFLMLLASAVGVAVFQVLFSEFVKDELELVNPQILGVAQQYGALQNYLYIRNMPLEAQGPIIHAYANALNHVFLLPLGAAGLSVIFALFLKNVRFGATDEENMAATLFKRTAQSGRGWESGIGLERHLQMQQDICGPDLRRERRRHVHSFQYYV
ncbi:major facilitator superfamily domain-containing protein [Phascolomyces articulosus]|uniref:Major facilitator superfamily domain-containing protein n=1 Tax=Phascolomyces articulosus TaxID=60185 RepID=A0AAD5K0Z9_9FUNG|nr:major facilitator superfamily domain-containing protein [Phascolomyces articulosus]